jgi:hypothetical protein
MRVVSGRRRTGSLLVLLSLCAAAALVWQYAHPVGRRPVSDVHIAGATIARAQFETDDTRVGITRDGAAIVYTAARVDSTGAMHETLMLRRVAANADVPLFTAPAGAEARSPFFSHDSTQVGFVDRGRLMKVPAAGGEAVELCSCEASPAVRALWLQDGSIVYNSNHRLRLLTPDGRRRDLTRPNSEAGERDHLAPTVLADQDTILFTVIGAVDTAWVKAVHRRTGEERVVLPVGRAAQYAGHGHVAYVDDARALQVIDLDPSTLRVHRRVPVAPLRVPVNGQDGAGWAMSEVGTLVHAPDATADVRGGQELTWVARDGRRQASGLPPGHYAMARIAPTGDAVALEVRDDTVNVWLWDLPGNRVAPLTTGSRNAFPEWLPDGQAVLITSVNGAAPTLNLVWRDGTRPMTPVPASLPVQGALSISGRGPVAVFRSEWPGTHLRTMTESGGRVITVTSGTGREQAASLSPDGRWLAYDATPRDDVASGKNVSEVFVRPFPDATAERRRISVGGGSRPLWSRDGREIFYLDVRNHMMRVEVSAGATPDFGAPVPFFADPTTTDDWFVALGRRTFDLTPDGSRFLAITTRVEHTQGRGDLFISLGWLQHVHRPWMRVWDYLTSQLH